MGKKAKRNQRRREEQTELERRKQQHAAVVLRDVAFSGIAFPSHEPRFCQGGLPGLGRKA